MICKIFFILIIPALIASVNNEDADEKIAAFTKQHKLGNDETDVRSTDDRKEPWCELVIKEEGSENYVLRGDCKPECKSSDIQIAICKTNGLCCINKERMMCDIDKSKKDDPKCTPIPDEE